MFGMKENGEPKVQLGNFSFKFISNRKKFYAISACVIIFPSLSGIIPSIRICVIFS